jgi:hypothetical protein
LPSALAGIGKLDPAERRIIEQSGLRDPSLLYPDDESLVPSWALFLVCFLGPGAVMMLVRIFTPIGWLEVHHVHLAVVQVSTFSVVQSSQPFPTTSAPSL